MTLSPVIITMEEGARNTEYALTRPLRSTAPKTAVNITSPSLDLTLPSTVNSAWDVPVMSPFRLVALKTVMVVAAFQVMSPPDMMPVWSGISMEPVLAVISTDPVSLVSISPPARWYTLLAVITMFPSMLVRS